MKKIIYIYCLSVLLPLLAHGQTGKEISTAPASGGTIADPVSVSLIPGFDFTATAQKSLLVTIGKMKEAAQLSQDRNYIYTRTYTHQDESDFMESVQYYDGLGRPNQLLHIGITPAVGDLASLQEYDDYGRESKSWLPGIFTSGNKGRYIETETTLKEAIVKTNLSDTVPYSLPVYEASPLNRVVQQYGPGQEWYAKGKAVNTAYLTNNNSDSLRCVNYTTTNDRKMMDVRNGGNYAAGELYVTRMTDEEGNVAYEFKDKLGQVVLTRQINKIGGMNVNHDTYYVYDDFGNLRAVLPPLVAKESTLSATLLDQLGYQYKYDTRNRAIAKKLPGADWVYYVYDHADRLIFSQDGEQRAKGEWAYSIPDAFGRIVQTGTCTNNLDYAANPLKDIVVKGAWNKDSKGYTVAGVSLPGGKLLSENYYDNYDFVPAALAYKDKDGYGRQYTDAKGLLTGTKTALLDNPGKALLSALYYDDRGQIVQSRSDNQLGGTDVTYTAYTFTGQPLISLHEHTANQVTVSESVKYEYDHAMRLLIVRYQKDNEEEITLAQNEYDDLGRLKETQKAGNDLLKTGYAYNIRSWTAGITGNLFSQKLAYAYNGNISEMEWKNGAGAWQNYNFAYDNLSRLTEATHGSMPDYSRRYGYDMQGNILSLTRGATEQTYKYTGNQLNDTGIAYNTNGAVTKDMSKNIKNIAYNLLNLPQAVETADGQSVSYSYAADGRKLKAGDTEYAGNFIYENGKLKRILIDGGYIEDGKYYFFLADHLGNNRVVADKQGNIIQANDYDPFGATLASNDSQPYKYNGKEVDKKLGLYDYSARYYDAEGLSKFSTMDPQAEDFYSWSPYMYSYNNPVRFIDPDGEGPGDVVKGAIRGYHKAVVSAFIPLSASSPIGMGVGAISTVSSLINATPDQRAEIGKQIVISAHEQSTLGLIEAGVAEYKAGGDGSQTGEKVGGVVGSSLIEAAATVATAGLGTATSATSKVASVRATSVEVGGGATISNITSGEVLRIRNAATRINKPISVVGSRASGTAKVTSDWDYVITGGLNSKEWSKIKNSIPGAKSIMDNTPQNIDIHKTPLQKELPYITINPK